MLLLTGVTAQAQTYPNGLSADSVNPEADSVFIAKMRDRMDKIRRTENRPTVALVLSGGGAKGAAEAGALQYLEDSGIPVDMVCGTSIGGLLGGLYSIGYTSADMRELFCSQDWGVTLTDWVDPEYVAYEIRMRRQKYLVNVPFHYDDDVYSKRVRENESYSSGDVKKGLNLAAHDNEPGSSTTGNLVSSLPVGYACGFNVNNLFSSLTVGYQDSISFADLPVPYVCVATDMVSCKANNWTSGVLKTAMRSTMSIPGLFYPVRTGGMILVDGGTRNNYPADIARACGVDYIIGIELADEEPEYAAQVNHLGKLLAQFIRMLGKDAYDENVSYPDVRVQPVLKGFNMLSFNEEAVDTMMRRGYDAIALKGEEIEQIKAAVGKAAPRHIRRAVDISKTPVKIGGISFDGLDDSESRMMMKRVDLKAGQEVDKAIMDEAMGKLQATGAFESVTYSLYGTEEPYNLVFHCVEGPTNVLSMGLRLDQEEWAAIMLDLGINTRKLKGSKFDFSARLGKVQKVNGRYSLDIPSWPTINAEAGLRHSTYDLDFSFDEKVNREALEHTEAYGRIFLSNMSWTKLAVEMGARYKYYWLDTRRSSGQTIAEAYPDDVKTGYFGLFANARLYTMDDLYFPSKGMHLQFDADADIAKSDNPAFEPIITMGFDGRFVIPFGRVFSIIPDLHLRTSMNNSASYFHIVYGGGSLEGRYMENQIPIAGTRNLQALGLYAAVLNLDFRFRVADNLYLSARAGYARGSSTAKKLVSSLSPTVYGFEAQAAYDSIIGPLKLNLMWSSISRWGVGFSMGFDF